MTPGLRRLIRGLYTCGLGAAVLLSASPVAAQAAPPPDPAAETSLTRFLGALDGNPELLAAQAGVESAELLLNAARDPVALEATGGYTRIDIDDSLTGLPSLRAAQAPTDPGTDPGTGSGSEVPSETGYQLSTTLVFRPFPFGDTADLLAQREIELKTSQLDLANARVGLEARALEAALQVRLAERSVKLSQAGVEAATQGLRAARLRTDKGAANARDLRDAEAALFEAQTLLNNAQLDAESARLNLQTLVGDVPPPSYRILGSLTPPAPLTPLSVAQVQLQTQLVGLQIAAAQRELIPVASASYAWNVSDSSTLTASLESRTLQPSVGFSYQDPGRTLPQSAVNGTFQVGISANISVGAIDTLNAAQRQKAAASESLRAAQQGGRLQETTLKTAYTKAEATAELDRRAFRNARVTYQENVTRQELGLSTPLETQTSLLDLLQADVTRRSSELGTLSALLDLYELYAPTPFGDPEMRRLRPFFALMLFVLLTNVYALTLSETLARVESRSSVVNARTELADAEMNLTRVTRDPLAVRTDTLQAEQRLALAQASLEQTRYAAASELTSAYTGVLGANAQVELAQQSLALSRRSLRVATIRLENGSATQLDLDDAQASLDEAQNGLRAATEAQTLALSNLVSILGEEVSASDLEEIPETVIPELPPLEAALTSAERHPDLLGVAQQAALAELGTDVLDPLYAAQAQIDSAQSQRESAESALAENTAEFSLAGS